jgi:hypothetical protein
MPTMARRRRSGGVEGGTRSGGDGERRQDIDGSDGTPEEIAALLEQRELAQDSHHRPHGRPTSLLFTMAELGKQFRRT